jgi:hypothetical protein
MTSSLFIVKSKILIKQRFTNQNIGIKVQNFKRCKKKAEENAQIVEYNKLSASIMKSVLLKILIIPVIALLSGIVLPSCTKQKIICLESLQVELPDRKSITQNPSPWYKLKQFSSYDRRCEAIRITAKRRKPSIYYNICYRDY